jgi:hypothetical protein
MSPYGNRDEASSRAGSIKTACTSRLGGVNGRAQQACGGRVVLGGMAEGWRRRSVWRGLCGCLGGFGDEMVGLASKHPQNGSTRLLSAALIGCGSSDLRSYLHRVSDHEHQCRSLIYLKLPSMHLCCRVLCEAQLRSSSFSQAHPSVLTYASVVECGVVASM